MNDRLLFNKNGFLKKKNFLSDNNKLLIKSLLREYFKKICYPYLEKKNYSLEDLNIHRKIINFRKKFPSKFGNIYDDLKLNAKLRSLFYSKPFLKLFSEILRVKEEKIFINGFMFRFDVPDDKRNTLTWHQDSPYYQQTYPLFNSGICAIGITKNNEQNGTFKYIPGSNSNFIKSTRLMKKGKNSSINYKTIIKKSETLNNIDANTNFGDLLLMHMNTKHKSGKNSSKKIRMSILARFHDMSSGFNSGKEIYFYNSSNKTKIV